MPESFESTARKTASVRDALTAAFTRPYFLSLLADERRFALDMGKPFCICLIDIDQLRKFNEQAGVSSGDRLLADVAEAVRGALDLPQWQTLRALMGRYDGDSFMLLMPGCRLDRAENFAHVIRRRISRVDHDAVCITASMAIAAFKGDDSIDELLTRAEKTLYLAKQFGGDRIEVSRTAELTRDLASVTRLPVAFKDHRAKSA